MPDGRARQDVSVQADRTRWFSLVTGIFGGIFLVVLWTSTSQGGPGGRSWGGPGEGQCEDWRVLPGGLCRDTTLPAFLVDAVADSTPEASRTDVNPDLPRG